MAKNQTPKPQTQTPTPVPNSAAIERSISDAGELCYAMNALAHDASGWDEDTQTATLIVVENLSMLVWKHLDDCLELMGSKRTGTADAWLNHYRKELAAKAAA